MRTTALYHVRSRHVKPDFIIMISRDSTSVFCDVPYTIEIRCEIIKQVIDNRVDTCYTVYVIAIEAVAKKRTNTMRDYKMTVRRSVTGKYHQADQFGNCACNYNGQARRTYTRPATQAELNTAAETMLCKKCFGDKEHALRVGF